jgi:hypothetical protein
MEASGAPGLLVEEGRRFPCCLPERVQPAAEVLGEHLPQPGRQGNARLN